MKISTIFISLIILLFACRPAKKIQKTSEVISKADTTAVMSVKDNKTADSATLIKDVYNKVIKNKINFTTFNAKVKAVYNSKEGNEEATAYIRLKKDSVMWLSLRGPLGIEGFRILITKDSVTVLNLLKKNVQYRSIVFLQQFTSIPFDFSALQDLVVGNPIFIDSNIHSYTTDSNNLQVLMPGTIFRHLITLDNTDYKLLHSKLDDINPAKTRSCNLFYSGYDNTNGVPFATQRKISVAEQSANTDIDLNFKQYNFNQPLTFPFNVPANYKRL